MCKEMLAALKAAEDEGKRRAELERRVTELTAALEASRADAAQARRELRLLRDAIQEEAARRAAGKA
jgi:hypothetical protein